MADSRNDRRAIVELEGFESALRGAYEHVWWRKFIEMVKERRASFIEALVSRTLDQRSEDRTRGQISELTFVLSLDQYGETHRDGGRETTAS